MTIDFELEKEIQQLNLLISYHEDIVIGCLIHRRVSEQTLEELTIKALKEVLQTRETKRNKTDVA